MNDALDILDTGEQLPPWHFEPPDSTVLMAPLPGEEPPTLDDVLQLMADFTGQDLEVQGATPPEDDMAWFAGCQIKGLPEPIAVWCSPVGELEEHVQAVAGPGHGWLVSVQTNLSISDPLTNYINLVRVIAGSMRNAPALLDPASGHWLERAWIDELFFHETLEPPEDVLWRLDVFTPENSPETSCWIRTVGLARCGRAELECHDIPVERMEEALDLLSGLAALSLEIDLPRNQPVEIGPGLLVKLIEEDMAQARHTGDEMEGNALTAIVDEIDTVLDALASDDVAVFLSERRTQQNTLKAQATWPSLLSVCHHLQDEDIEYSCLVQVPFEQADGEDPLREHLWLRIVNMDNDTVEVELVHEPCLVEGLSPGWRTTVAADELSGWILHGPHGTASSTDTNSLQAYLENLPPQ